jgi:hypothetical protein
MPIEFKEKCAICEKTLSCWGYNFDEPYDENKGCTGVQCDFADSEGCFGHYCNNECFEKHKCGAYTGKEYVEKN